MWGWKELRKRISLQSMLCTSLIEIKIPFSKDDTKAKIRSAIKGKWQIFGIPRVEDVIYIIFGIKWEVLGAEYKMQLSPESLYSLYRISKHESGNCKFCRSSETEELVLLMIMIGCRCWKS